MTHKYAIVHETAKRNCIAEIEAIEPTMHGQCWEVEIRPRKVTRSLEQNALYYKWLGEIAEQSKQIVDDVRSEVKLNHGIPILRRHEDFEAFYQAGLAKMDYETRLSAMKYTPVSSIMSVQEMSEYMEALRLDYTRQGYRLTDPEVDGYE